MCSNFAWSLILKKDPTFLLLKACLERWFLGKTCLTCLFNDFINFSPFSPLYSEVCNRREVWNGSVGWKKYQNSKNKIKIKVTSNQNLEHFKMINRRWLIRRLCNNSKTLLSSSWTIFIRVLLFSSSPRANFSSFEYLWFFFLLIFRFILI